MSAPYLVWDWNGTLFDDRALLFTAIAQTLRDDGFADLSPEQIAAGFCRPMRAFFERLIGRELDPAAWERVQSTFHRIYRARIGEGALVAHAREVLARGRRLAAGQVLVSQWRHDELVEIVRSHQLTGLFDEVRGRRDEQGDKVNALHELLHDHPDLDPRRVVLIGDARSDAAAAAAAGIGVVLVVSASLEELDPDECAALAIPVVGSIGAAIDFVCRREGLACH